MNLIRIFNARITDGFADKYIDMHTNLSQAEIDEVEMVSYKISGNVVKLGEFDVDGVVKFFMMTETNIFDIPDELFTDLTDERVDDY